MRCDKHMLKTHIPPPHITTFTFKKPSNQKHYLSPILSQTVNQNSPTSHPDLGPRQPLNCFLSLANSFAFTRVLYQLYHIVGILLFGFSLSIVILRLV